MKGRALLVVVAAVGMLLTGCRPAAASEVATTATRFQQLVSAGDWGTACGLLSEHARAGLESTAARPCADALAALRLPPGGVGDVEVWGRNAEVAVGQRVLFLSQFTAGWRVVAAGCTSQGEDLPYQCTIGG